MNQTDLYFALFKDSEHVNLYDSTIKVEVMDESVLKDTQI